MTDLRWPLMIFQSIPSNRRQPLGATLNREGALYLTIPGVLRGRPEIGHYVLNLGVQRALEFRALIEEQKLWELPSPKMRAPEQPAVTFIEGEKDARRSAMWTLDVLPPEAITVLDVFNKLIDEAYTSPRRVLSGQARWKSPSFSAREPLEIEFTLHNKGDETIVVQNPMTPQPRESLLRLLLVQDPPPPDAAPAPKFMEIRPTTLSRPDEPRPFHAGPPGEHLEVAPGQSLRFVATPSVYLSPAEYQAVLIFDTGWGSSSPKNHVRGLLAMELPPLRIVHR